MANANEASDDVDNSDEIDFPFKNRQINAFNLTFARHTTYVGPAVHRIAHLHRPSFQFSEIIFVTPRRILVRHRLTSLCRRLTLHYAILRYYYYCRHRLRHRFRRRLLFKSQIISKYFFFFNLIFANV